MDMSDGPTSDLDFGRRRRRQSGPGGWLAGGALLLLGGLGAALFLGQPAVLLCAFPVALVLGVVGLVGLIRQSGTKTTPPPGEGVDPMTDTDTRTDNDPGE